MYKMTAIYYKEKTNGTPIKFNNFCLQMTTKPSYASEATKNLPTCIVACDLVLGKAKQLFLAVM